MPFTPFHFGPGLLLTSLFPRAFSFVTFVLCQVLIDCETAYYLFMDEYPVHRFWHSVPGGVVAGLASACVLWICRRPLIALLKRVNPMLTTELGGPAILVGGLVGGVSHSLLDNVMHSDVRLLYRTAEGIGPYDAGTGLYDVASVANLHIGCLLSLIAGVIILFVRMNRGPSGGEEAV